MPVQWTNNFNDTQSTDVITAAVAGSTGGSTGTSTLSAHSVTTGQWAVGDEFTIDDNSDTTLYSITSITMEETGRDSASIGHSPVLAVTAAAAKVILKEDSYKGNHRSAENHLRLRNMGII